ncbi:MAG: HAD hydrolase-like protein [Bacillota bacterium]|nr:HAD hydrolase-like protein [Bacillota bacterium]
MALIFFDFDGVLVDSLAADTEEFKAACHSVGVDCIKSCDDMSRLSEGNFYQGLMDMGVPREKVSAVLDTYAKRIQDPDFHLDAHRPMMKLVKKLAKKYPLYIVTSNLSFMAESILEENGVKHVEDVLGADKEISKIKKFQKIKELYPGEKSVFVSDTKGDMLEAAEAGIDVRIGVTWGWQKPWVVASGEPDYLFCDFSALKAWFKGFLAGDKII